MTRLKHLGFVLLSLCTACSNNRALDLSVETGDEGDARARRMAVTVSVSGLGEQSYGVRKVTRDYIVEDCLTALKTDPGGTLFTNGGCDQASDYVTAESDTLSAPATAPVFVAPGTCDAVVCESILYICVANRLLELANAATKVEFTKPGPVTVTVPPQDVESQSWFAEEGWHYAAQAATLAGDNLRKGAGRTVTGAQCTSANLNTTLDGVAWGQHLASGLMDSVHLADEAARLAAEKHAAIGDADHSRNPDPVAAAKQAWIDPTMSRVRGAHVLVGGALDSGLSDNTTGVCPCAALSDGGQEALDLIRLAAPPLADVTNLNITFDSLFAPDADDIRARLRERTGDPAFDTMTSAQFLSDRGLTEADFTEARVYLGHEATAFGRDTTLRTLAPFPLAGLRNANGTITPQVTQKAYYAATGTSAVPPPPVYYRALTRFAGLTNGITTQAHITAANDGIPSVVTDSPVPDQTYARRGLAQLHDYAHTVARDITTAPGSLSATVQEIVAEVAGTEGIQEEGRQEVCYRYYNAGSNVDEIRVRVHGYSDRLDFEVMTGVSGLRCAVTGTVEGAPCALSQYKFGTEISRTNSTNSTSYVGYSNYIEIVLRGIPYTQPGPWLFVVKKDSSDPAAPGFYKPIGGMRVLLVDHATGPNNAWRYCSQSPVNADIDQLIDAVLTPSTQLCSRPETSCAGPDFTQRIPLENELSSDGDDRESSWRVYLDRANEASDRADALGEQLIQAGLEMDQRIEAAEEELQALCGGSISLANYFPGLGTNPARGAMCSAAQEGQECAVAGQVCQNGWCATDSLKLLEKKAATDPMAKRLFDCLGGTAVHDYVTLGSRKLCVWTDSDGKICTSGTAPGGSPECPYLPNPGTGSCSTLPAGAPMAVTPTDVDTFLSIFQPPEEGGSNLESLPVCSALRNLRDPNFLTGRDLEIGKIDGAFDLETIRPIAERIGWEARPRAYSAITLDGVELWSTGSTFKSVMGSTTWPCVAAYEGRENKDGVPCNTTGTLTEARQSLFCSFTSDVANACGNTSGAAMGNRARMNHRLGRAVLALRILTGVGVGPGFRGPMMADDAFTAGACTYQDNVIEEWTDAVTQEFYPGSITGKRAAGLLYDYNGSGTNCFQPDREIEATGAAFCLPNTDFIWTDLEGGLAGTVTGISAECEAPVSAQPFIPMFMDYEQSLDGTDPLLAGLIWHGLDDAVDGGETNQPFRGLALGLLKEPPSDVDAIWITPYDESIGPEAWGGPVDDDDGVAELTSYWTDDNAKRNTIGIARDGLRARDILDAMELLCEVQRLDRGFVTNCADAEPPPSSGSPLVDLAMSSQYLECKGNEFLRAAERQIFADVPGVAVDALTSNNPVEGELGAAAGEFAASMRAMGEHQQTIASEIRGLAFDMNRLRLSLTANANSQALAHLQSLSVQYNQIAACASSIFGGLAALVIGGAEAPIITCANAAKQAQIAIDSEELTQENLQIEGELSWDGYRERFLLHVEAIANAERQFEEQADLMRAALARMETKRAQGRRLLAKAMMLGTDTAGTQYAVNTVMRRRYNTLQIRYDRARRDAVNMAWLARRAIEQRLGFRLDEMKDDLALVEAPSSWVDEICTSTGIDYTRIRNETELDADNYADAYIGDYVRKLERVVQSYEHDFPFTDAEDMAVISLRDDVVSSRAICETSVNNLLAYSALLDTATDPETGSELVYDDDVPPNLISGMPAVPVWQRVNCASPVENCIAVSRLESSLPADMPIPEGSLGNGEVPGYRVKFRPGGTGASFQAGVSGSAVAQIVSLPPGYYRVSWYGRQVDDAFDHPPAEAVRVRSLSHTADPVGTSRTNVSDIDELSRPGSSLAVWRRYHFVFRSAPSGVIEPTSYEIAIVPKAGASGEHAVDIAGLQLEDISHMILGAPELSGMGAIDPTLYRAGSYVATRQAGIGKTLCEDTSGEVFQTHWRRGCERLCPTGFGDCDDGETHCFWEMPFAITVEGIERGGLLRQSGFAYGNYNYRIDALAVNLVGTGLRDCALSPNPSTCYSAGNVPYSLHHLGPFVVRNHSGDLYEAPLYDGRIEHGRGLAAERYLSNPISSADRALLTDYWHTELRGRPLTGHYLLRIWDADGVTINRLEDAQIALNYRYWTRFE
jgi:hypothetical protein